MVSELMCLCWARWSVHVTTEVIQSKFNADGVYVVPVLWISRGFQTIESTKTDH